MGIPTNNNLKNGDKYTLFDNPVRAFEKANLLLKNGGTLLLGPDLNIDKSTSFKYKLTQWTLLVNENFLDKKKYELINSFHTRDNFIFVLRKS